MKQKIFSLLTALFLFLSASSGFIYAKDDNGGSDSGDGSEENRVRVEIRGEGATVENAVGLLNQQNLSDEIGRVRIQQRDNRVRIEVRAPEAEEVAEVEEAEDEFPEVEVGNNKFEITGEVGAVSGNTFTIAGRIITIDPSRVADFEQKVTPSVGQIVKVEGIIEGTTMLAREIKSAITPPAQIRAKFEVKGIKPIPTNESQTNDLSATGNVKVEVKTKGSTEDAASILDRILSFLRSLV